MTKALVGVLGGSGLYEMEALADASELHIDTPFGSPSDAVVRGTVDGIGVAFLARHGRGHRLLPSEVPYRANIHALRQLGVRYVLSVSAVGSLRENMRPLDLVLPDQFIDLTRQRKSTFFGDGAVAHVSMAEPVCTALSRILARSITSVDASISTHSTGTYVCVEGPQFSSLAESRWLRSLGADIVGMTNMPEAKLAREAQMAYATLAMVTDYDCWHPREPNVSASLAINNLHRNASRAQLIVAQAIRILGSELPASAAHSALDEGLVTSKDSMPETTRRALEVFWS